MRFLHLASFQSGFSYHLKIYSVVVSLFFAVGSNLAYSIDRTPYRTRLALQGVYELKPVASKSVRNSEPELESIPTVRVSGKILGEGNIDARFYLRRNKTWSSFTSYNGREIEDAVSPVLLQGKMALGRAWSQRKSRSTRVAASMIGKELKISFAGRLKGARKTRQRIYTIRMSLDGSVWVDAQVQSIPAVIVRKGGCGANVHDTGMVKMARVEESSSDALRPEIGQDSEPTDIPSLVESRIVTISTDADREWYAKHGVNSNAVIAGIINSAEALYDSQLGVRFRIVRQHVYSDSSPYSSTDAGTLLTSFVTNPQNSQNLANTQELYNSEVDLKHLFTGKDLDGSVVGIAYIGVLCSAPTLAYGLTQSYSDVATPGIFAHEVGHNFGALHDVSDRSSVMYPSISIPPSNYFSSESLAQVNNHLNQSGSCLSTEWVTPRVTPTTVPVANTPEPEDIPVFDPNENSTIQATPVPESIPPIAGQLILMKERVGDPNWPVVHLFGSYIKPTGLVAAREVVRLLAGGVEVAELETNDSGDFEFFLRIDIPQNERIQAYVESLDTSTQSNMISLKRTPRRVLRRR